MAGMDTQGAPTLAEPWEPTDVSQGMPPGQVHWAITGYEADASANVEIKAAESGKHHYITHVTLAVIDDDAGPLLQDEDDTLLFGPVAGQENGGVVVSHRFRRPIKLDEGKALEASALAAGIFSIYVEGFTASS